MIHHSPLLKTVISIIMFKFNTCYSALHNNDVDQNPILHYASRQFHLFLIIINYINSLTGALCRQF